MTARIMIWWGMLGVSLVVSQESGGAGPGLDYPIKPVPLVHVRLAKGFWETRLETNRRVTIPHAFRQCEETGRIGNFAKAGGLTEGAFAGTFFNDSDVYKVVEGAAYALATRPDPELDAYLDDLIAKIAAAQEEDGYLYTSRTLMSPENPPPGGKERWSDIANGHELYCAGHLYEAAAAHFQATGKRTLLEVARKNADLVCAVFGPEGRTAPPGHQEIEIGLARLFRVTGERTYLEKARFFLECRGRGRDRSLYGPYSQDHLPVRDQAEAVGHAVRAGYMYAGMAEVAALTGEAGYVQALDRLWDDVVSHKLYLTGGIGARGGGEAFGNPYELPNMSAYCETCAAIANVFWNHRLFLLKGEARYLDVMERTLYNGLLAGVGLEGNRFFYPNPLMSMGQHARTPWFGCACCPSNVARFVASLPAYCYAQAPGRIYLNLFAAGSAELEMDGVPVKITQETDYPWSDQVRLRVEPARPIRFALAVRVPGWATGQPVPGDLYRNLKSDEERAPAVPWSLNGETLNPPQDQGFAVLEREWRPNDLIEIVLPLEIRRMVAHPQVVEDRGRVALERGPLVYCLEWPDHAEGQVLNLLLEDEQPLQVEWRADLLGGIPVITGRALALQRGEGDEVLEEERFLTAVPYHLWAHRGSGEMTVWIPRLREAARPRPRPTVASQSKVRISRDRGPARALHDQLLPRDSNDHSMEFVHWWPHFGTTEWVEYHFAEPVQVSQVKVYWFDDERTGGGCRVPESWSLFFRRGEEWIPVENPSGFGVTRDTFNLTTFQPVTTGGLRLEVRLRSGVSGGLLEWEVE